MGGSNKDEPPAIFIDCDLSYKFEREHINEIEPLIRRVLVVVYGINMACGFTLRGGIYCAEERVTDVNYSSLSELYHHQDILLYFYDMVMDMLIYCKAIHISPFPPGRFPFYPNTDNDNFHILLWKPEHNTMLYKTFLPMQEMFDTMDDVGWLY